MGNPSDHLVDLDKAQHVHDGGLDAGACTGSGCPSGSTSYPSKSGLEKNSCNYRRQVVKAYRGTHPEGRKQYYVTPQGETAPVKTDRYQARKSKNWKPNRPFVYPAQLPAPDPKNRTWDIDGPDRAWDIKAGDGVLYRIEAGSNFEGLTVPWWNNAHHLIPKSSLKNEIARVKNPKGWKVAIAASTLVKRILLKVKYNVNHQVNMIILPMDRRVGEIIGLPRHLILEDEWAKARTAESSTITDHEAYRDMVEDKLGKVLKKFVRTAKAKKDGKCVSPEMKVAGEELEKVSRDLYKALTNHEGQQAGGLKPGRPISLLTSPW